MMMDLFSAFDPVSYKLYSSFPAMWWFSNFAFIFILMPTLFTGGSRFNTSIRLYMGYLIHWLDSKQTNHMKGMTLILAASITVTLSTNMIGQLPYTYPITVSPIYSMSLCLPIWIGAILSSLSFAYSQFLASLIPLSTPLVLTPIVVTAELMSNLVRPISHCARLTINTTLGHLYLKLAASFSVFFVMKPQLSIISTILLSLLTILLIFFEILMAALQSYIFCFLLTIYISDHPRSSVPVQDKAYIALQKMKNAPTK